MILIAHRGNVNGKMESHENEPTYVDVAISKGYDVEIDVWYRDQILWLGHDRPQYQVDVEWIVERSHKLWVHCKDVKALEFFNKFDHDINYFWHEQDTATLTSKKHIWGFPGKQPIKNSIAVLPEIHDDNVTDCKGICSDFIQNYNNNHNE